MLEGQDLWHFQWVQAEPSLLPDCNASFLCLFLLLSLTHAPLNYLQGTVGLTKARHTLFVFHRPCQGQLGAFFCCLNSKEDSVDLYQLIFHNEINVYDNEICVLLLPVTLSPLTH